MLRKGVVPNFATDFTNSTKTICGLFHLSNERLTASEL